MVHMNSSTLVLLLSLWYCVSARLRGKPRLEHLPQCRQIRCVLGIRGAVVLFVRILLHIAQTLLVASCVIAYVFLSLADHRSTDRVFHAYVVPPRGIFAFHKWPFHYFFIFSGTARPSVITQP